MAVSGQGPDGQVRFDGATKRKHVQGNVNGLSPCLAGICRGM